MADSNIYIKYTAIANLLGSKEVKIFEENKIEKLFSEADYCINLVGILYEEKRGNTFKNIHTIFPTLLAKLCKKHKLILKKDKSTSHPPKFMP